MSKKRKLGRNEKCTCGSGLKYKKCCDNPLRNQNSKNPKFSLQYIPTEVLKAIERHKANEAIRQQQQGFGKPIIAEKFNGQQLVAVGNTIYHSPKWKTFPDFLSYYLKKTLGAEWGIAEIKKPLTERHSIMQWYEEYCHFQRQYTEKDGELYRAPATGVVYCYLGLAYNLYLLKHNVGLQELLVKRLKNVGQFQGAYYELIVANCLIRAGFDLVLEDETDRKSKHCEFAAISKRTGERYSVEAKMRSVVGILGKDLNDGTQNSDATSELIKHINAALRKPADDKRLIFIDLNTDPDLKGDQPTWLERAARKLETKEKNLEENQRAYVFVTNIPFHRTLRDQSTGHAALAHGLGIDDFAKPGHYRLSEIYKQKQKHRDAHDILSAFKTYTQLPSTFDGSLPSVAFSNHSERIVIGETYFFEDIDQKGVIGTVTTATVNEIEKNIYFIIKTEDSKSLILTKPMSDDELIDYKNHPEGFFGSVQSPPKKTNNPYELFEWMLNTYKNTPKERLLEFMKEHPDLETLKTLSQEDLAITYCERCVGVLLEKQKEDGNA